MNDEDLKTRFESLRAAEAEVSTSFVRTLAAARSRTPLPAPRIWPLAATVAGIAAVALLFVARMETPEAGGSLSETLPILLPPAAEPVSIFPSPLFATSDLPSDSVLPLSSRFPL